MYVLSILAIALPPRPEHVGGVPALDVLSAVAFAALLLGVVLLCWWAWPARRSAPWLASASFLVIEWSPLVTRLALADREQPGGRLAAPGQDRAAPPRDGSTSICLYQTEREILHQAGFTPAQIDRLLLYRRAFRAGSFHPDPAAPARLAFARWLYQHGKLSG